MLDLRFPIGLFFVINATILIAVGLLKPVDVEIGAFLVNLNLAWGAVIGVFGTLMLWLSLSSTS